MFKRFTTKTTCVRNISAAMTVVCLACSLVAARPSNATSQSSINSICVMDDNLPLQQFKIYLYDEYGNPVDVTTTCSYQQGHVFNFLWEEIGTVQYQTGHVFDAYDNDIGYVVAL